MILVAPNVDLYIYREITLLHERKVRSRNVIMVLCIQGPTCSIYVMIRCVTQNLDVV
jgi:hypothetical protein